MLETLCGKADGLSTVNDTDELLLGVRVVLAVPCTTRLSAEVPVDAEPVPVPVEVQYATAVNVMPRITPIVAPTSTAFLLIFFIWLLPLCGCVDRAAVSPFAPDRPG